MITTTKPAPTMASGSSREGFFGIKEKNASHVFGILRGRLYSDKPMAILREYGTNAQDAHVEAGCPNRPIEVTLPTPMSMRLSIRDYGTGLSEDEVFDVFASYGESTKRETNSQVGMLGLGSKSAFSYVNSFTIISCRDGERSMYEAYLDETGLGKISLMHREPTEDGNGLEIQIAISSREDIKLFETAAMKLFHHWSPLPVLRGSSSVQQSIEDFRVKLEESKFLEGSNWYLHESVHVSWLDLSKASCVMGNVRYSVQRDRLSDVNRTWLQWMPYCLVLSSSIGDVEPAASREELEYNRSTIDALNRHLDNVRGEIVDRVQEELQNASSPWEARCVIDRYKRIIGKIGVDFTWKGQPISAMGIAYTKEMNVRVYDIQRRKWMSSRSTNNIPYHVHDGVRFFVECANEPQGNSLMRIHQYLMRENLLGDSKNHPVCICVTHPDRGSVGHWLGHQSLGGAPVLYLADLPYVRAPVSRRKSSPSVEVNRKEKAFCYNGSSYASVKRDAWDAVEVDLENGEGVYVPIHKFLPQPQNELWFLKQTQNALRQFGFEVDRIHGFKKLDPSQLGKGWKPLSQVIRECCLSNLSDPKFVAAMHRRFVNTMVDHSLRQLSETHLEDVPEGLLRTFCARIAKSLQSDIGDDRLAAHKWLASHLNHEDGALEKPTCIGETAALYEAVQSRYPLLFNLRYDWERSSEIRDNALAYVALVDRS